MLWLFCLYNSLCEEASRMEQGVTDKKRTRKVYFREEKRFEEYGCTRKKYEGSHIKHLQLTDRLRWTQTKKQFKSIAPVIHLLAKRDKYTAEHSVRVALMVYRLCMLIDISRYYRDVITLSGFCHDIGKLAIPDGILHKKIGLTDEEYEEIKHHPTDGAELLGNQSEYTHLIDGVLYHQERWDGKGYPFGKKGKDIPFPARIIAIADSTDAMLSDRPYRSAFTEEECIKDLKKNSGIMYEPWIVDLFIDNWNYIIDGIYSG